MDHFNATVQNGTLVSTKRGMRVSKTKHHGTCFVNAFAAHDEPSSSARGKRKDRKRGSGSSSNNSNNTFHLADRSRFQTLDFSNPSEPIRKVSARSNASSTASPHGSPLPAFRGTPDLSAVKIEEEFHDDAALEESDWPTSSVVDYSKEYSSGAVGGSFHVFSARKPSPPNSSAYSRSTTRRPSTISSRSPQSARNQSISSGRSSSQDVAAVPSPAAMFRADVWTTHAVDALSIPIRNQRLVHFYLNAIPSKMYPMEHILTYNPARTPGFFEKINVDLMCMQSVVLTANLIEVLLRGKRFSNEVLHHTNLLCTSVNKRIAEAAEKRYFDNQTIECVASMAIGGTHIGRYDHWHVHMRGLKQILDARGGVTSDMGYAMNKVRRADVKGAAVLGDLPYIDYVRGFDNVSDILPSQLRHNLAKTVADALQPCNIRPIIIESVASLTLFHHAIRTALSAKPGEIKFDPHAFVDEWYWVEYQLVRHPCALRDENTPVPSVQVDTLQQPRRASASPPRLQKQPTSTPAGPSATSVTRSPPTSSPLLPASNPANQQVIGRITYQEPTGVLPAHADNLMEPAIRLASILYVETLVPDLPRTLNGYTVLLSLLSHTIQSILDTLQRRGRDYATAANTETRIDSSPKRVYEDGLPCTQAVKPVLLWISLVGFVVAWMGDEEHIWGYRRYERSVYRDCIAYLVGPGPGYVDSLDESIFALCEVLDIASLLKKPTTERDVLRVALREYVDGVDIGLPG